ncbi:MAG: hypothetical protein IPH20_16460 [Bacteroidales bacterium]|nr:hypothetical protein [Bacteroidales bacterium]
MVTTRAKFSWYTIAQLFYDKNSSLSPDLGDNKKNELSRNSVRNVRESDIFPMVDNLNYSNEHLHV